MILAASAGGYCSRKFWSRIKQHQHASGNFLCHAVWYCHDTAKPDKARPVKSFFDGANEVILKNC